MNGFGFLLFICTVFFAPLIVLSAIAPRHPLIPIAMTTTTLDAQILAAVRHAPVNAKQLASNLASPIQAVARAAGARPSDVLGRHLLQLNDAGRIRYLAKADGWVQVNSPAQA